MIRIAILFAVIASLTACARYREPTVNCFSDMADNPIASDCDFTPLGGPDPTEGEDA